jgi:hypothetical protein
MGFYKGINNIALYCSLMAIPINLGLPEQIEDILRIYEKVLGEETGIESSFSSSSSEMNIKNYANEVISEIRQIRDNEPFCNE